MVVAPGSHSDTVQGRLFSVDRILLEGLRARGQSTHWVKHCTQIGNHSPILALANTMAVVASRTELTLTWTPPTSPDSVCDLIGNKRKHIDEAMEMEKANTRKVDDVHDEKSDSDATSITPLSTSEQLEYLTVNEYKWPSLNRKRQRMSEDERKARHREVQRQFMQRKLAKLDEMRHLVVVLEKQYLLLQLSQERARLEHENDYLSRQVAATPPHWSLPESQPRAPAPAQTQTSAALPWDEILEAVSEANV